MSKLLASSFLELVLFDCPAIANTNDCGSVALAGTTWLGCEDLSNVDRIILSLGDGFEAEIPAGDTVPTTALMTGNQATARDGAIQFVRQKRDV